MLQTFDYEPYSESKVRANFVLLSDTTDTLQGTLKAQNTQVAGAQVFQDGSGTSIPSTLWDVDFTAIYNHRLQSGNDWGLFFSAGSDSDVPFNSFREVDSQITATYHIKVDELHSWILFLNYSLTRNFLPGIPLPGAGYLIIDPLNHTQLFLGLPFFFGWQPTPDWSFSFSYLIPTSIDSELSYKIKPQLKAHGGFQWTNELWLLAYRNDVTQHLIFDEKRFTAGIRSNLSDDIFMDVYGGFIFDQTFLLGQSITSRNSPTLTLPAGLLAELELAYRF